MRWFRFYTEVLHDPKIQRLSPFLFKCWVNILCIANRDRDRGTLPSVTDVAFALRVKPAEANKILEQLETKGLLDRDADGVLAPHNWSERQRESDASATRQQRYREKKKLKNRELSKKVTLPSRGDDALDTDLDKTNILSEFFEELWKDYPDRDGKKDALRHFLATVKNEGDCQRIRKALTNYLAMLQQESSNGFNRRPKTGKVWFNNWADWVDWKPIQIATEIQKMPDFMTDDAYQEAANVN